MALVLLTVGLSGCNEKKANDIGNGKSDAERIVGTWESSGGLDRITFTTDGYMHWFGEKGDYWLEDGYLYANFTVDNEERHLKFKYTFESDNTLIMESDTEPDRIYTKV